MRRALLSLAALALVAATTAGCRSLPTNYEPPAPTFAMTPAAEGTLAAFADSCGTGGREDTSGFVLIHDNEDALRWRLALVDSAAQSIDIQTYLWESDFSGGLLLARILQAAERGVRVRLLVDDWELGNRDRAVAALDDHPNIEFRVWNPGRRREVGRKLDYAVRLSELNHRMHNKVFIVDNRVAISGGRNIADDYFGLSSKYNMLDLDLLAVGPAVPQLSGMFDRYWNSKQAAPGAIFHAGASSEDIERIAAGPIRALERSPLKDVFPLERQAWGERFEDAVAEMIPATYEVLYDRPGHRAPGQGTLDGLKRLFDRASTEVAVLNPYFVPADEFIDRVCEFEAAGVTVSSMTNSLGSADISIVNHAYAKRRRPLLEAGVDLFELRHDGSMKADVDTPPVQSGFLALHGKAIVVDREHVFVGSYNISPRSRDLNTEMGLLVHSPELGSQLADFMGRAMAPENAWRVSFDESGRLQWTSSKGTVYSQPAQNLWQRFKDGFFGLFPIEKHL